MLQLDASEEFQSDPVVQEQFISKVIYNCSGTDELQYRGWPREGPICMVEPSFLRSSFFFSFLPGEELLQFFVNEDQQWEQMTIARLLS